MDEADDGRIRYIRYKIHCRYSSRLYGLSSAAG